MSTSLAAVPKPRLPSISEIEKSLRDRLPGLTVYNPSERWLEMEVFGLTIYATPDLHGAIEAHPTMTDPNTGGRLPVTCDGRTMVRGRYPMLDGKQQRDSSGKVIEGQDAPAMVKFLTSPDKYGQMGLVWIPGADPAEDAKLMELSRGVYRDYQRGRDEMVVSRRAEFKANWLKSPHHKGEPCPPPTATENAAMDRLQQRKRAIEYRFDCPVPECPGYASSDWDKFAEHMKLAHGQAKLDRSKYESGEWPVQVGSPPLPLAPIAEDIAVAVAKQEQKTAPTDDDDDGTDAGGEPDKPQPRRRR